LLGFFVAEGSKKDHRPCVGVNAYTSYTSAWAAGGVFEEHVVPFICHDLPAPATKSIRHFLRHLLAET
jgi:hypothetical protein